MNRLIPSGLVLLKYLFLFGFLFYACSDQSNDSNKKKDPVKVIYSTDLSTPHGDPDDHFDLMTLLSLKNVNVLAVILDDASNGYDPVRKVRKNPNFQAVEKACTLFNREMIPTAAGLRARLKSPDDQGLDQAREFQGAVQLILSKLRQSNDKEVIIITTGSLRDVCAAYNRNPELFCQKVCQIYVSIGDSFGQLGIRDHNTKMDVNAWCGIMSSDLPIFWLPCNPSKGRGGPSPYVSYWNFIQSEFLMKCPVRVQDFFNSEDILTSEPELRHMWSTPAFIELAGRHYYDNNDSYEWLPKDEGPKSVIAVDKTPYKFLPIVLSLDSSGKAIWRLAQSEEKTNFNIFKIEDQELYGRAMFQFLSNQLIGRSKAKK